MTYINIQARKRGNKLALARIEWRSVQMSKVEIGRIQISENRLTL